MGGENCVFFVKYTKKRGSTATLPVLFFLGEAAQKCKKG
jgi:hypothetical protein